MHAFLCDTCRQPMEREGYEFTLIRGTIVNTPGETTRLTNVGGGAITATLCNRCGERLSAIVRHKLQDPCPVCEVAPMRAGDARADAYEAGLRKTG